MRRFRSCRLRLEVKITGVHVRFRFIAFLFMIMLVIMIASYVLLPADANVAVVTGASECDPQLSAEVGDLGRGLCLRQVSLTVSPSNSSEFSVPVMIMKPGTSTVVDVLYVLASERIMHPGPLLNITSSELPVLMSVPSGTFDAGGVTFSNASDIFQNARVVIFSYTLTAATNSSGYYAILPRYYFGMYPALVVSSDPNHINMTALSLWGYTGTMISSEFFVPSYIVGTGDLNVINASVPMTESCMNPACVRISHSQY